ncbi:putative ubiquitin-protein ligase [Corchorus olitorius]|uniref:Ubiquitin-protein ligase n=1 Tax=Corchorus olitorius TaxID=93759 RepID=A0A1R3KQ46_9ROSI|nr:putative ubiquitin-protein ligase [Corchorus olitorius]
MRTSILSSNLRHLWTNFSGYLDFDVSPSIRKIHRKLPKHQAWDERMDFVMWVNGSLECIQSPTIEGFRVSLDVQSESDLDSWIIFAVTRKAKNLELDLTKTELYSYNLFGRVHDPVALKRFLISDPSISLKCLELTYYDCLKDAEISGLNLVSFKFNVSYVDVRYKNLPRLAKCVLNV